MFFFSFRIRENQLGGNGILKRGIILFEHTHIHIAHNIIAVLLAFLMIEENA